MSIKVEQTNKHTHEDIRNVTEVRSEFKLRRKRPFRVEDREVKVKQNKG